MSNESGRQPNGIEKASILLLSLDAATSAEVFKLLSEREIEILSSQMVKLQNLYRSSKGNVLAEFEQMRSFLDGNT